MSRSEQMKEEIELAEAYIKDKLKAEFEARDAIVKQTDDLADIIDIALAALQDHQPALSATLMRKAKAIFNREEPK